ncbi:serine hydrolase [Nonomuraea sp. NPDC052634]|uniref:serine hydrolase n=1 Tax=Nonomuraea sp. NPDC052634 TaxID=3155813 RepID=UPI00343D7E89
MRLLIGILLHRDLGDPQLADAGLLEVGTRVADVLPGFAVADPQVTRGVTIGQLLTHTSGIAGDFTLDTGRGDDCLARHAAACAEGGGAARVRLPV